MLGEVHRADERPAAAQLDDPDPAQVERPHPEPFERQIEERQQQDLEDAVMADDDRPGLRRLRLEVAGDLRSIEGTRDALFGQPRQDAGEGGSEARGDVGDRFAARRPRLERSSSPGREDVAPAALDLLAVEALPLALADLE